MDIATEKMGPCPVCLGVIKPCKCQVQYKLDKLESDLRKLVEEMEGVGEESEMWWAYRLRQILGDNQPEKTGSSGGE
jgi:hypothetical protein